MKREKKKYPRQGLDILEMIRHDLEMRDFELVFEPPVTSPLRFHIIARADDLLEEDIPGYITVRSELRKGLFSCECDPDSFLHSLDEDRVCTITTEQLQAFLDIVEEATGGRVSTYEACDDGLAYRIELGAGAVRALVPDFVFVEEILFGQHVFSAITPYSYVPDTLLHWPEIRDSFLNAGDGQNPPVSAGIAGMTFPLMSKKTLPS